MHEHTAIFAAGCFWGVEQAFRETEGVLATRVGYTGGHTDHPSYEAVCTGSTGHAEAVEVRYDPDQASYTALLELFFQIHDPTQVNRQGPDIGTQYRSAIFVTGPEQRRAAEQAAAQLAERLGRAPATEIAEAGPFWPAEAYHQQYLARRGRTACASTLKSP